MKVLVLDNYDSFTYNLVHLAEKVSDAEIEVYRNDEIKLEEVGKYDKILLSPGPGLPKESGILCDVIREYSGKKSILGVCLGLQAIGECFGGKLRNLEKVYHGIATPVKVISDDLLFQGLPVEFNAGRYHSWVIDNREFPSRLEVTAVDENGLIMAARHRSLDVRGVQFHPESILSEFGEEMMRNWILHEPK